MSERKKAYLAVIGFALISILVTIITGLHPIQAWPYTSTSTTIDTVDTPDNHTPTLTTDVLPYGNLNQTYSFTIEGVDQDSQDNLTITAFGFPPGFKLTNCQSYTLDQNFTNSYCVVVGTSTQSGVFRPHITIRDDHHASTQTRYQLNIK